MSSISEAVKAKAEEELAVEAGVQSPASDSPPKRKRGRPKGSKTKPRPDSGRGREEPKPDSGGRPKYQSSDVSIAACATIGNIVWNVAAPQLNLRPLTDEEAVELGGALDAVAGKYVPDIFERWAEEIGLAFVVLGLYAKTQLPPPTDVDGAKPVESSDAEWSSPGG